MQCNNCPRLCNQGAFFCKKEQPIKLNKHQLHHWEEPCISGSRGSGTIFFSHCNMACVFCQNYTISQQGSGRISSREQIIDICWELSGMGAHNINFVTPSPYIDVLGYVMQELKAQGFRLPFVWNSSAYESMDAIKSLEGLVDIYLPDFKYSKDHLAVKYSSAPGYPEIAINVIKEMRRQVMDSIDDNGIMHSGLIVRHLVIPADVENSKGVLELIKQHLGTDVMLSLMSQFFPSYKAQDYPEINRTLVPAEYDVVYRYFMELGFENGYTQGLDSANDSYVPEFCP